MEPILDSEWARPTTESGGGSVGTTRDGRSCVPLEPVSFGICRWIAREVADPRPYRDGYEPPAEQGAPGWRL
eukprot:6744366-Alexandrium_andersonii.AAC.1